MKVLVTGGAGFVAPYLTEELRRSNIEVILTDVRSSRSFANFIPCDLRDKGQIQKLLAEVAPDAVIHLAAMSHVGKSWENPESLLDINLGATISLCEAARALGKKVRFLFASTSMIFQRPTGRVEKVPDARHEEVEHSQFTRGKRGAETTSNAADGAFSTRPTEERSRFNEGSPVGPENPYGMSKLAAEYAIRVFTSEKFKPYIVRPFNHIGPGQSRDFVCSAFARRVLETPNGGEITTGNLDSERDFSDVRDIVRAYRLILEKEPSQDLFVLGSGKGIKIKDILHRFIEMSGKKLRPTLDRSLLRPSDPAKVVADAGLAKTILGWQCEIPFEKTLQDIFEDAKKNS